MRATYLYGAGDVRVITAPASRCAAGSVFTIRLQEVS